MAQLRSPCWFVLTLLLVSVSCSETAGDQYRSAVGDPGMRRDGLRLGIEAWNQCNEVGEEAPNMGSPRAADCFDVYKAIPNSNGQFCFLVVNCWVVLYSCFLSYSIFPRFVCAWTCRNVIWRFWSTGTWCSKSIVICLQAVTFICL